MCVYVAALRKFQFLFCSSYSCFCGSLAIPDLSLDMRHCFGKGLWSQFLKILAKSLSVLIVAKVYSALQGSRDACVGNDVIRLV